MNVVDFFWIYGPSGIWFLAFSIFFSSIVSLVNTQRTVISLKKMTADLSTELEHVTSELRIDTGHLRDSIAGLKQGTDNLNTELGQARQSIDDFHKTLRCLSWWTW